MNYKMKILVLDNYDSFTYNLVHLLQKLGVDDLDVYRNDKISLDEVDRYDKIVLSPGPGIPDEAGIMKGLIKQYASSKCILGVCLGHQAIAEVYGGLLLNLDVVHHGVATKIIIKKKDDPLYKDIPDKFKVGRYHSWIVDNESLPEELEITALDESGQIMSINHKKYDVKGVQFHPESILSEYGEQLLSNWLNQ